MTEAEQAAQQPPAERLLDAAERLVVERGAAHLTLDAVAAEAGVSTGGLLYHFPSKAALLDGMVQRHLREVDERAAQHAMTNWSGPGSPPPELFFAARMRVALEKGSSHRAIGAAMLAAAAANPTLLDPCRQRAREAIDEMAQLPLGFDRAAILHLAVDGLILSELLHLSPFTAQERSRIVESLLSAVTTCGQKK